VNDPARELILASASPRRLALLREAGFTVDVRPSNLQETWPNGEDPAAGVVTLALHKARRVAAEVGHRPVLGADTEVVIDEQVLGKPESRDDAAAMLRLLSGRTHSVFSGVALVYGGGEWTGCEESTVTFRELDDAQIESYLARAEYADKAGAYGIQEEGRELVQAYTGRLDTIIGLPLNVVERLWQGVATAA